MSEASSNTTHWAIGAILLFIGAFVVVALVLVYSQADSVDTSVDINNIEPSVDSIFVSSTANAGTNDYADSGIDLVAGGTKTIHVNGVVSDANGANDISDVDLIFFRSILPFTCSLDKNNCYQVDDCTLTPNDDTSKYYNCPVNLQYYTDATDDGGRFPAQIYRSRIQVNDNNSASVNLTSVGVSNVEVNTLLAVSVPASINFGTLSNNTYTTSVTNKNIDIVQQGNDEADLEISGVDMTCSGMGTIPIENQKWSLEDVGWDSVAASAISGIAVDTDFNLGFRESDIADFGKTFYMDLYIPFGVNGVCTGINTVTTIAH